MPNFNARIKPAEVGKSGKANIKIRVTHKGESRTIPTAYYIEPINFDNEKGRAKPGYPLAGDLNVELQALELSYSRKLLKINARIEDVPMRELLIYLTDSDNLGDLDFYSVTERRIEYLKKIKKNASSLLLEQTLKHVKGFNKKDTLAFSEITPTWLERFQSNYNASGSQNSAAIHLRNIRTIFNIGIDDYGLSHDIYPFRKFKIKTVATIHRDLNQEEVAHLINYQTPTEQKRIAVDLWLLSFFLQGTNFKDLLLMPRTAMNKGYLIFNRRKTDTIYKIKVEPEALAIISKYKGTIHMLRFIEDKEKTRLKRTRKTAAYKDITDLTNEYLKDVATDINTDEEGNAIELIEPKLSTYYARHSWASIASSLEISHDIIKEALGHSRSVTDTYINFYVPRIDKANRQIIDTVKAAGRTTV